MISPDNIINYCCVLHEHLERSGEDVTQAQTIRSRYVYLGDIKAGRNGMGRSWIEAAPSYYRAISRCHKNQKQKVTHLEFQPQET